MYEKKILQFFHSDTKKKPPPQFAFHKIGDHIPTNDRSFPFVYTDLYQPPKQPDLLLSWTQNNLKVWDLSLSKPTCIHNKSFKKIRKMLWHSSLPPGYVLLERTNDRCFLPYTNPQYESHQPLILLNLKDGSHKTITTLVGKVFLGHQRQKLFFIKQRKPSKIYQLTFTKRLKAKLELFIDLSEAKWWNTNFKEVVSFSYDEKSKFFSLLATQEPPSFEDNKVYSLFIGSTGNILKAYCSHFNSKNEGTAFKHIRHSPHNFSTATLNACNNAVLIDCSAPNKPIGQYSRYSLLPATWHTFTQDFMFVPDKNNIQVIHVPSRKTIMTLKGHDKKNKNKKVILVYQNNYVNSIVCDQKNPRIIYSIDTAGTILMWFIPKLLKGIEYEDKASHAFTDIRFTFKK